MEPFQFVTGANEYEPSAATVSVPLFAMTIDAVAVELVR